MFKTKFIAQTLAATGLLAMTALAFVPVMFCILIAITRG